jgi:hypothetical protein
VLTAAADPGVNAFMPPAASPPPTNTQPPPTLQPHGNGDTVATLPLPGDRDGLYGGTVNNAEVDREKMITFFGANPPQANSFVESLNSDTTTFWSGGNHLSVADIPTYLHELTPAVLRLDTRITDHGFDGMHSTNLQSVFQAGNAVLVDAHGVPRVRGLNGNPLTAPIALRGEPKLVGGAPWPGYRPGALAEVLATTAAITNFVLVDVVTGQPFNRPAGTTGPNDTPHTQPIAPPQAATSAPPTTTNAPALDIDGTYLLEPTGASFGPCGDVHAVTFTITHQGSSVTLTYGSGAQDTGTLNPDGSFSAAGGVETVRGVFATEGGRTVIRNGHSETSACGNDWTATKQ